MTSKAPYQHLSKGVLNGNRFNYVDITFQVAAASIDRTAELYQEAPMTVLRKKYSERVLRVIGDWDDREMRSEKL